MNTHPRIEMEGNHPTINGTKVLIHRINHLQEIIADPRFIVNDRNLYGEVQSHFMYGCLLCDHIWDLQYGYCPEWLPFILDTLGFEQRDGKRSRSSEDDDDKNKKANLNKTPTEVELLNETYADVVLQPMNEEEILKEDEEVEED